MADDHPTKDPDEGLDAEAGERAADEGMLAPEEDPDTWGELESEKLDGDTATGAESADISGAVPGDD